MMNTEKLICPICKNKLVQNGNAICCVKRHCFDIARQGYVNLLPVQNKKSLHPGDTKEMLVARRKFLESGIYTPICNAVKDTALNLLRGVDTPTVADIGCGEGYYTTDFKRSIRDCNIIGADISKDAVKMACNRDKEITWITATAGCLPIADESIDLITAIFSLVSEAEYLRVLKKGGYVIDVSAGNDHLKELKEIIYDDVYIQDKKPSIPSKGFKEIFRRDEKFSFTLENEQLKNLLIMTPHLWRIKKENRERLENMNSLSLTAHFWIRAMQKI